MINGLPNTGASAANIQFKDEKPVVETKQEPVVEAGKVAPSGAAGPAGEVNKGGASAVGAQTTETTKEKPITQDPEKPVVETGKSAEPIATEKVVEITEDQVINVLNKNHGVNIRNLGDVKSVFEENKKLKIDLENKELTFPTPQAKALYDFAVRFPGNELTAAQNYLQNMSIDIDKADPKGLQFEAFLLSKPNLDRKRGETIFNAMYEKKFGEGFETDPLLSFEHEEATREAKDAILKARESFPKQAVSSKPGDGQIDPKQIEAVTSGIGKVMEEFDGITIAFDDSKEGSLDFGLPPEEVANFKEALLNPQGFFDQLLSECTDEKGNLDYSKYASEMYEVLNRKQMIAKAQSHGFERGKLTQLQELKNTRKEEDNPAGGSGGAGVKKTKMDAWVDAMA